MRRPLAGSTLEEPTDDTESTTMATHRMPLTERVFRHTYLYGALGALVLILVVLAVSTGRATADETGPTTTSSVQITEDARDGQEASDGPPAWAAPVGAGAIGGAVLAARLLVLHWERQDRRRARDVRPVS